jgi:hypothetical protein
LKSTDFGGIAGKSAGMVSVQNNQSKERIINSAIPFEVIDAIEKSTAPHRLHKIVLPDCDHAVSAWLRTNPVRAQWVASEVAEFLSMP